MQWRSYWWGIEIIADTKDDEALLLSLMACLPKELGFLQKYDDGILESKRQESDNKLMLVFNR